MSEFTIPIPDPNGAGVVTRETIEAFTQRLVEKFGPEKVILFGSQARGDARWDSDADILVVMPYERRPFAKTREIRRACQPNFRVEFCYGDRKISNLVTAGVIRSSARP